MDFAPQAARRTWQLRQGMALAVAGILFGVGSAAAAPPPPSSAAPDTVGPEVDFMQGMILHHAQALEMARLAPERTDNDQVLALMRRIEVAQEDEISLMKSWLDRRGHLVPSDEEIEAHARGMPEDAVQHGSPGGAMAGMLTRGQFEELEEAEGRTFDRRLLEAMIFHHEGAIIMVQDLLETPQAVAESEVFSLVTHVETVQQSEITRMQRMLRDLDENGSSR